MVRYILVRPYKSGRLTGSSLSTYHSSEHLFFTHYHYHHTILPKPLKNSGVTPQGPPPSPPAQTPDSAPLARDFGNDIIMMVSLAVDH